MYAREDRLIDQEKMKKKAEHRFGKLSMQTVQKEIPITALELPALLSEFYADLYPLEIIYEGQLMKYSPGFKYQYISRYCSINKFSFKYYKNQQMASKHIFPLVQIPFQDIDKVERVRV